MSSDAWGVIATVALFGAANLGTLLYRLGGIVNGQKEHARRLDVLEPRVDKLETGLAAVRAICEVNHGL